MRGSTMLVGLMLVIGAGGARAAQQDDLLNAANHEAQRLGYDVSHMSVAYDDGNTQWEEHHVAHAGTPQTHEVDQRLHGHVYQAVYYSPEADQLGGDLWVLIDAETGEVLAAVQGQ